MSCFVRGYNQLRIFENDGLYKNQVGAIGAALAHFSTRNEPGLITMPTGTGKTAVMIVLSYALRAHKILVITPSQLVREQIANHFREARLLVSKGVIPGGDTLPRVYELTGIVTDSTEWEAILSEYDVIVGIPGTLNKIENIGETIGASAFDTIFVDEAHHSRAKSWSNILASFPNTKQILLTATPFRRDRKDIKARLIYNYPLKQAYEDGLFSHINYVPVNTNNCRSDDDKNAAIAREAERVYQSRNHADHKIIIRTDTKASAERLAAIYSEHTSLNLVYIHSKLADRTIRNRINQLTNGEIDGVICVDMMGEGYDFPALKIAAIHIPHKSLAITLQFVGRISRTNIAESQVATVVAGEHDFKVESEQLYKESKDWSIVLPDLHRTRIQETEDEQEFFDSFDDLSAAPTFLEAESTDEMPIEDDDLRPFFHAKLYSVFPINEQECASEDGEDSLVDINTELDFDGTSALSNPIIRHHHVSTTHHVAIYVVSELTVPKWLNRNDSIKDIQNELFIIHFDRDNSILAICATLKDNELYEHLAVQFLKEGVAHQMIPLPLLKRVMSGWVNPKLYNVGMKSRKTKGNGESYKNILGSLAQEGVLPTDRYSYTRGHSFGGGYDSVLQKDMLIGISTSSKVWGLDEKKVKYLVDWLKDIGRKVGDCEMDKLSSPLSELDCGKVIDTFPDETIFFADWDSSQYHKLTSVVFIDSDGEVVEEALLCSCSINVTVSDSSSLTFNISKGGTVASFNYRIKPSITFEYLADTPHKIAIKRGANYGSTEQLLFILNSNPINIYYESLNKLTGRVYFEFNKTLVTITDDQLISHNWPSSVNINKEFYTSADMATNATNNDTRQSIHDYIIELAKAEFDVVFYDHAALEIADIIGIKEGKVKFYHCKKQDGANPRCTVDDIYEVSGQAVKSVHWSNRKLLLNQICDRADQNNSSTKIKKGNLGQIRTLLEAFDNPIIPVEIVIVQPGLKTRNLTGTQRNAFERVKTLLSGAETFLKDVSQCTLSVMCS